MPVELKGISGTASKEESKRNKSLETNGSKTYQQPCHPVLRVMQRCTRVDPVSVNVLKFNTYINL